MRQERTIDVAALACVLTDEELWGGFHAVHQRYLAEAIGPVTDEDIATWAEAVADSSTMPGGAPLDADRRREAIETTAYLLKEWRTRFSTKEKT